MLIQSKANRLIFITSLLFCFGASVFCADSPFAKFKQILDLPKAKREVAIESLNVSSDKSRAIISAKIKEYEAMPLKQRNHKLDALDFRWHLLPLLKMETAMRKDKLTAIPERFREDILNRLNGWDKLDVQIRESLIKNESFFRYMSSFGRGPESRAAMTNHLVKMPSKLRENVEERIVEWRGKQKSDRRKMKRHFHRFFELQPIDQQKALSHLSIRERTKMEASLIRFKSMTVEQREIILKSFDRLADMSQVERTAFFRNSQRWNEMSNVERKQWRTLVTKMPPLPPGFEKKTSPPLPPGMRDPASGQTIVTNSLR